VVDGLSRHLNDVKHKHRFQGLSVGRNVRLSHLLFVDDVLIFYVCGSNEGRTLQEILKFFFYAMGIVINVSKSDIYFPRDEGV
jgi:hypothetical protein